MDQLVIGFRDASASKTNDIPSFRLPRLLHQAGRRGVFCQEPLVLAKTCSFSYREQMGSSIVPVREASARDCALSDRRELFTCYSSIASGGIVSWDLLCLCWTLCQSYSYKTRFLGWCLLWSWGWPGLQCVNKRKFILRNRPDRQVLSQMMHMISGAWGTEHPMDRKLRRLHIV